MSLDLYINSKKPVKHKGTGVFVRKDGQTVELTLEECKALYPGLDFTEQECEDHTLWHGNITHNLGKMAKAVVVRDNCKNTRHSLYQLLWRPEETRLLGSNNELTREYVYCIAKALKMLQKSPNKYKKYNPENGWGSYEQLVSFVKDFVQAIDSVTIKYYCDHTIEASI